MTTNTLTHTTSEPPKEKGFHLLARREQQKTTCLSKEEQCKIDQILEELRI